jgi:glycosyltransferase involved in cell wall biosynthesis
MRVLIVHNTYRLSAGEDTAVRAETDLLRNAGIEVLEHWATNEGSGPFRILDDAKMLADSAWSRRSAETVRGVCERFRPDVVHVHNFWLRLTPAIHQAARSSGAAVVQTLHNFRLLCVNGSLSRNGHPCHDCVGKTPWRGVVRRCYRQSLVASAAVARMVLIAREREVWRRSVDAFIAPTEYVRQAFVDGGLPADRIHVKPNFTADPGPSRTRPSESDTVLFAGRLAVEKGVDILLRAWAMAALPQWRLTIAGDGPESARLRDMAASMRSGSGPIEFTGAVDRRGVRALMARARLLVLPSGSAETFGMSVIEAFAAGRPAIVTGSGGQKELVQDGVNGFQVASGDPVELANAIDICFASDRMADRMGAGAREAWAEKYSPRVNLRRLLRVYETALERRAPACPVVEEAFQ